VSILVPIRIMNSASDSTGQHNVDSSSDREQWQDVYSLHNRAPYSKDESVDNFHMDNFLKCFDPVNSAPEISGNANMAIPIQNDESEIRETGGYTQWSQFPIPTQNFSCYRPAGTPSLANESSFPIEEFDQSPDQCFESYRIQGCQFSDLENDVATGYIPNPSTMINPAEYQLSAVGWGGFSASLPQPSSPGSLNRFQTHIDDCVTRKTKPRPSTPNTSLPSVSSRRTSSRRSKVLAIPINELPRNNLCDRCYRAFKRAGDLRRHYRVHLPGHRTFPCSIEGCNRSGEKGFYRRDKLRDHQRQAHGFHSTSSLVLLQCFQGASDE
jgi:hypothetical protein